MLQIYIAVITQNTKNIEDAIKDRIGNNKIIILLLTKSEAASIIQTPGFICFQQQATQIKYFNAKHQIAIADANDHNHELVDKLAEY